MTADHAPKTAALIAHTAQLLSSEGERRLVTHLTKCDRCREELARIRLYEQLAEEVRTSEVPEVDFAAMELSLAREARRHTSRASNRGRGRAAMAALGLAAAALLAWFTTQPPSAPGSEARAGTRPVQTDESDTTATAVGDGVPRLTPRVTLAVGEVAVGGRVSGPGDLVSEGETVSVGSGGAAHVRLERGTGISIASDSEVELVEARAGQLRLRLAEGGLTASVAPLDGRSSFVVLAAEHEVRVVGTLFRVYVLEEAGEPATVGVEVVEGTLEVATPTGSTERLDAPIHWRSDGGLVAAAAEEGGASAPPSTIAPPHGLEDGAEGAAVTLSAARIVRWAVGGTDIHAETPVTVWLPPGEHGVRGWDGRGDLWQASLSVADEPMELPAQDLVADAPRIPTGHIPRSAIDAVTARGRARLPRCAALASNRTNQPFTASGTLTVTVGPSGDVARIRMRGMRGPGAEIVRECVRNITRQWVFPAPRPAGSTVTFTLPLRFVTRGG